MDLLELYSDLDPRYQELMKRIETLRAEKLDALLSDAWRMGEIPEGLPVMLGKEGLLGADIAWPPAQKRLDAWQYGLIMRGVEACDSGFRSFISVQSALASYAIARYGSPEQGERYMPSLLDGSLVASFALTEAQGGSDPASMQTRAVRTDKGWLLEGHKRWVTNAGMAAVIILWARTDEGVRAFLVEPQKHLIRKKITEKLSLQASATYELEFSGLELAEDAILPKAKGLGAALDCLNQARYGICWGVLGAAEDCFQFTQKYIKERQLFGRSLASFQLSQAKLVECSQLIIQAQLLAFRLAALREAGKLTPVQISMGKMNNVHAALQVARICRELLGANGILLDHRVMRHMTNLETVYTYEGTHDIHKLVVGHHLTGESAFK